MAPAQIRATDYLLWTAALAWPFGVFLQTPIAGITLSTVIVLALLFLLIPDALTARRLRIPFELWAPSLAIAVLVLARAWSDPNPATRDTLEALLFLLLIVQANPGRDRVQRYVAVGMVSAGVAAVLSLSAPLGLLPTAFSFHSGANFVFAYTLPEAVHTLLVGAMFALYQVRHPGASRARRTAAVTTLSAIAMLLALRAVEWWRDTHVLPGIPYPSLHWSEALAVMLAGWLVARVWAKVQVARRDAPDPLLSMWIAIAVLSIVVAAFAPIPPRSYQGFLVGLACATALPARTDVSLVRRPMAGALAVVTLVVTNLLVVFPVNIHDPRQYDAAAQREMPRVFDRMDWFDRHAPNERRTYFWRARAAMEYGLPNLSSFAFARATHPPSGPTVLAPPAEFERQQFLVRMRDIAAALPEDRAVCAYERVLLANGERDAALYSLRLRTGVPLIHVEAEDVAPYATVAALILGDASLAEDLRTWTVDEVLTLLSLWGADATFAGASAEAPGGLFILAAQRRWDTFRVHVRVGERVTDFDEPLTPVTQRDIDPLVQTGVMVWAGPSADPGGNTRYTLNVLTGSGVQPAAYVDVAADGAARFYWAERPPVVAYTPAVRVRIGK